MKAEIGIWPKNRQILHKILPIDTPLGLDFHITGVCNFRCNYCIWSLPKKELKNQPLMAAEYMSMEIFETALNQIKEFPNKIKHITLTGGEPLLHKNLPEMIKMISDADVTNTIQVISNGSLLNKELCQKLVDSGLTELKISLQGLNEEAYCKTSSAKINWQNFYDNIKYFSEIKGNCKLKVKVADTALNPGDDKKFFELFGDICDAVDIEHIYDAWAVNGMKHENLSKLTTTRYGRELQNFKICSRPFTRIDILPDGQYSQFCHVNFGFEKNIMEKSILEQWNGYGQNKFREEMLKYGIEKFSQCQMCSVLVNTWHPEDILDGHEEEILKRMKQKGMLNES